MKTQYYTATSLDGYIATEDHSLEWLFQLGDPAETSYPGFIAEIGALAMGSSTYEWLLRHHVKPGDLKGAPWPYTQPTWVFTTRALTQVPDADIRFVRGDVRPVHAEMAKFVHGSTGGKNLWIVGGGELAGLFHDAGLLDELIVQIGSVTLGKGQPLLPRRIAFPPMKLLSAKQIGVGLAELHYELPKSVGKEG